MKREYSSSPSHSFKSMSDSSSMTPPSDDTQNSDDSTNRRLSTPDSSPRATNNVPTQHVSPTPRQPLMPRPYTNSPGASTSSLTLDYATALAAATSPIPSMNSLSFSIVTNGVVSPEHPEGQPIGVRVSVEVNGVLYKGTLFPAFRYTNGSST